MVLTATFSLRKSLNLFKKAQFEHTSKEDESGKDKAGKWAATDDPTPGYGSRWVCRNQAQPPRLIRLQHDGAPVQGCALTNFADGATGQTCTLLKII
jgi:hypothetical protein